MVHWVNQPAGEQISPYPEFLDKLTVTLTSHVIGCEVNLTTPNNPPAVFLAETLLAALEAFLATGLNLRVYPYRSKLEVRLRPALYDGSEPTITLEVVSGGVVEITHPRDLQFASSEARRAFKLSVLQAVAVIMFQIAAIPDAESYLELLGEEGAFSRALDFSDIAICVERVLGSEPKLTLSDWEKGYDGQRFAVNRKLPWDNDIIRAAPERPPVTQKVRPVSNGCASLPGPLRSSTFRCGTRRIGRLLFTVAPRDLGKSPRPSVSRTRRLEPRSSRAGARWIRRPAKRLCTACDSHRN